MNRLLKYWPVAKPYLKSYFKYTTIAGGVGGLCLGSLMSGPAVVFGTMFDAPTSCYLPKTLSLMGRYAVYGAVLGPFLPVVLPVCLIYDEVQDSTM